MLGRLLGRMRRTPAVVDDAVSIEVDGVHYDGRALSRPQGRGGVWAGWTGRIRRAFSALAGGAVESRAITDVPWAVGGTLGSASSSQDRALRMGPVFSAVRLIADHVSTLPIKAYRKAGGKRIPRSGLPDLFFRLDEDGELIPWLKRCVTSLMLRGNAYGLITERDSLGFPVVIQWLDPSDVSCNDVNPWAPIWYWMGREIPREDLLHIPWFVVAGKVQGLSPIEAFALTTNTGLKAQEYGETWFDNGGVPPGTFKNSRKEVDQSAAEHISDRLVSAIRTRRPIVYGADWDYEAIVIPPEQAQFIQTLSMTATQIAAIYGLPPEMIGGSTGDPMTYKTEEQFQQRLNAALRPLYVLLESAFSAVLPRFEQVKLNADAVARADLKSRYEAYKIAQEIGLLSLDEMRALEDLPPLPPGQRPTPQPAPAPAAPPARSLRHLPGKHNQDSHGSDGAGEVAKGAIKDALKIAGKIELAPGEQLVSSGKVDGDWGGIRMALTEREGIRKLRLGVGTEGYGKRDRSEGIPAWDGNPSRPPLSKAERQRLKEEDDALEVEYEDSTSPARRDEIDARREEIHGQLVADDLGFNGTAQLDEHGTGRLIAKIRPALAEAVEQQKAENAAFDEIEALQAKGNPDPGRMAELQQIARIEPGSPGYAGIVFAEGIVPGSEWGDVHYSVELDDLTIGAYVRLGVKPKDAPDDWGDRDWMGRFDAAETRKFLRMLDQHTSTHRGAERSRSAAPSGHQAALSIRLRAFPPPLLARPLRAVS